jgi:lipoteichoic acid synthase
MERRNAVRQSRRSTAANADRFLVVLIVLALLKVWLSRFLGLGAANPLGVFWEIPAVLVVLCGVDLLRRRRSYTIDLVAYSVLSILMLANVMYVSYYGVIVTPALLKAAGQAGEVHGTIEALFKWVYLFYVIDIPFLAAWGLLTARGRRKAAPRSRRWVTAAAGVSLLLLALQTWSVFGLPADVDSSAVATSRGFGAYQLSTIARLALPDPSAAAAKNLEKGTTGTPAERAAAVIEQLRQADNGVPTGGIKPGQYKGKNVIIVQVESLQDFVLNKTYDGKQISPNLNALSQQSWYFPNTYSQVSGGNTVDAEFAINTSLYPPVNGISSMEYGNRDLPGLPKLLRQNGYDAVTMHCDDVHFWNRKELYPSLGFRRYWDGKYFHNADKMWHASDVAFFQMGEKALRVNEKSKQPFYAFMITLSSHAAYDIIPLNRKPLRLSASDEKTLGGLYIGSVSFTDMAIGQFISALKRDGMWDNTIFVVIGDHSADLDRLAKKPSDTAITNQLVGRTYSDVDRERVGMLIHLPGQTTARVDQKPAGDVDIMPTIAELTGVSLKGIPHFGRSVFVDSPSLIPTRVYEPGGTFIDDTAMVMPGLSMDDATAVDVRTGQKVPVTAAQRQEDQRVNQLSLLSDAWIKSLPIRAGAGNGGDAIIPH